MSGDRLPDPRRPDPHKLGAGEDRDARRREALYRRRRQRPRGVGHDRDAGAGERLGGAAELVVADVAQGEGMADRDAAAEAEGGGPTGDLAELETAERAGI